MSSKWQIDIIWVYVIGTIHASFACLILRIVHGILDNTLANIKLNQVSHSIHVS